MIAIMRPLNDPALKPTKRALAYMENSCLTVEKCVVPEGMTVTQDERAKRARYLKEESLLPGDVLAVRTKMGKYLYYAYLTGGTLVRIADGETLTFLPEGSRTVDFGPEPDLEAEYTLDFPTKQEVLEGVLAQERFVLLRLAKA